MHDLTLYIHDYVPCIVHPLKSVCAHMFTSQYIHIAFGMLSYTVE